MADHESAVFRRREVDPQTRERIRTLPQLVGALDLALAVAEDVRRLAAAIGGAGGEIDTEIGEDVAEWTAEGAILATTADFAERLQVRPRRIGVGERRFAGLGEGRR